jgi:hypothetical protein
MRSGEGVPRSDCQYSTLWMCSAVQRTPIRVGDVVRMIVRILVKVHPRNVHAVELARLCNAGALVLGCASTPRRSNAPVHDSAVDVVHHRCLASALGHTQRRSMTRRQGMRRR